MAGGLDLSIITDTMKYGCACPGTGWNGGRCWKCEPCKAWRATLRRSDWAARTSWEIFGCDGNAWFITLTFRFKPKEKEAYGIFQRYLKRVRKGREQARSLRYICCSEFGEQRGRYHLHAVVVGHGEKIVGKTLRGKWENGITHARAIAPADAARVSRYVGKYLSKAGRVRASNGWGNQIERVNENVRKSDETVDAIFAAFPGAKVVAIKAPDAKRVRAPYHLRRSARVNPDIRPREWFGLRPSSSDDVSYPHHWVWWGEFSPLPDPTFSDQLEGVEGG